MNSILFTGINLDQLLEKIGQLIDEKLGTGFQQPAEKNQSKFISRAEVAQLLKISLPTLHEWTKLGWLKAYRMGTRVLYKQEEVESALCKVASFKHRKGGLSHAA
jgi:excisionase family DNA binding protein